MCALRSRSYVDDAATWRPEPIGGTMAEVRVSLRKFDSLEKAMKVADDIRAAGSIEYTNASGSTVNVTVGDVTVENT